MQIRTPSESISFSLFEIGSRDQDADCVNSFLSKMYQNENMKYFKDNFRTIEAEFPKNLRTTEAHFEFTGPYKKKSVYLV